MIEIKNEKIRKALRIVIPAVLIPAVVAIGIFVLDQKRWAFVSLAVTLRSLLLFAAVMTALSVAGRFIPFLKPVTALTVIAGIWLGGETGFLVGALSALISNFYFGQGPWTPFQMLSWGLIGLFAGLLSAPLKKSRALLLCYGAVAGVAYSLVMDVWSVLWYSGELSATHYLSALAAAAPYTVLYAASNIIFLLFLAKPFGEKLGRVVLKYRI